MDIDVEVEVDVDIDSSLGRFYSKGFQSHFRSSDSTEFDNSENCFRELKRAWQLGLNSSYCWVHT